MTVPLDIAFREVNKTAEIEELIRAKTDKLQQVCEELQWCTVTVEAPQKYQRTGNPYRVRIEMGIPGSELVVKREVGQGFMHEGLATVIRDVFDAARRQLKSRSERKRGEVKSRAPETQMMATVVKLDRERDYGFLRPVDGLEEQEIYFHRNSVTNDDFDRLEVGTGVRFVESQAGEEGPQASTVEIVNKPGVRAAKVEESTL
jgi:cold shock CspA family protein